MSLPTLTPPQQAELDAHGMARLAHFENHAGTRARGLWIERNWDGTPSEEPYVVVRYAERDYQPRGTLCNVGERKFDNYDKALAYAKEIDNA